MMTKSEVESELPTAGNQVEGEWEEEKMMS